VALDGELQVIGIHTGAVVLDQDTRQTTEIGANIDLRGAGVDSVLDQFLDRRSWALDDFTGGDAIDGVLRETLN